MSDKDKRDIYDKHGEEGVKQGGGPGGGMDDILGQMVGGARRQGGAPKKKQVKPIMKQVEVSLADVYNGKEIEVDVDRQRVCNVCDGIGGTDSSAVQTCSTCKGRGMVTRMRQMGPGMYSQSTGPCDDCNG